MKNVLGFVTLLAASFVHAEDAIIFPTQQTTEVNESIVFPTVQHPIALVGGYEIENGILHSRTYDCGINISDLNLSAQLVWEGATPKVMIVGDDLIMCRSLANSPFELDINPVLNQLPNHDLYRLELANHVILNR